MPRLPRRKRTARRRARARVARVGRAVLDDAASTTLFCDFAPSRDREGATGISFCSSPPGHDAWTVGDEPCVAVDFGEFGEYAKRG
jgi:hypothetical protein